MARPYKIMIQYYCLCEVGTKKPSALTHDIPFFDIFILFTSMQETPRSFVLIVQNNFQGIILKLFITSCTCVQIPLTNHR